MTTILIADDNEQGLYQLQVLLRASGYQVASAANGAEALTMARQNLPDLIVSDILMPVMDGFSLCREWNKDERLRAIPFVFYTASYTDDRDRQLALSIGAKRFIVKPEEPDTLIRAIREAIEEGPHPPSDPGPLTAGKIEAEETGYLTQYSQALVRRLQSKMQQLEQANRALAQDIAVRKLAEAQMAEQLDELRRWHEATLGREERVLALKTEVNELLAKAGQPPRYVSALEKDGGGVR
jgi:CheY-like chemotaxis protein